MIFALVAFATSALASTTYTTSVPCSSPVSSLTVTATTSGMTNASYGLNIYNGYVSPQLKVATSTYSYTIDSATYDLSLTFPTASWPSGYCGTVTLKGLFPGPDTTHDYDFKLNFESGQKLGSCHGCYDTSTQFARRTYQGIVYVSVKNSTINLSTSSSCDGTVYVYFLNNKLYYAHSGPPGCVTAAYQATALTGAPASFPTGSVPIGHTSVAGGVAGTLYDDRPF